MIRKTLFALAATATLGAAALVPTSASAHGIHMGGGHWGGHFGGFRGGFGITVVDPGYSCLQTQWVKVGYRTYQKQLVNVCNY
jgi:Spy/CpxP family protein refolding chaperone